METKNKDDARIGELYKAYGKFAIEFEQMCLAIRTCIIFTMHKNGLTEQTFIRILLADQTAHPLIAKLRSFVAVLYKENPQAIKHLDPLFKAAISINESRNEIIHGTWYVGWANGSMAEFDVANSMKDKLSKNGIELNALSYNSVHFDELTRKVTTAKELFYRLHGCIIGGHDVIQNVSSDQIESLA
jgi:hypothetical protein